MKKLLLLLFGAFMLSTSVSAKELVPLALTVIIEEDDRPVGHDYPKSPTDPPTVYIEEYTLTFDMRYDCANESRRTADNVIATTGGNVNTACCGLELQGETYYAPYPTASNTWEEQRITFATGGAEQPTATIRFGLSTTANQGAANQTRLYIDNVRLWMPRQMYDNTVGIRDHTNDRSDSLRHHTFDLSGRRMSTLPQRHGVYISGGRKIVL